jgi:hypothetical protein
MEIDDRILYTNHSKLVLKKEALQLRKIVCSFDRVSTIAKSVQVIDCNNHSKTRKSYLVEKVIRLPKAKPFQFLHFLN